MNASLWSFPAIYTEWELVWLQWCLGVLVENRGVALYYSSPIPTAADFGGDEGME